MLQFSKLIAVIDDKPLSISSLTCIQHHFCKKKDLRCFFCMLYLKHHTASLRTPGVLWWLGPFAFFAPAPFFACLDAAKRGCLNQPSSTHTPTYQCGNACVPNSTQGTFTELLQTKVARWWCWKTGLLWRFVDNDTGLGVLFSYTFFYIFMRSFKILSFPYMHPTALNTA